MHTRAHMSSATSLLPLYSINLHHTSTDLMVGHWSIDMSRGSLPPDHGSVNIEMFTPQTGFITPSSVNQFILSSRPPMTMQVDAALAMSELSKEQAGEIFLLTCEAQILWRKLAHDFILLSHKEALFHMGVQATGYEKAASGCPDHVTVIGGGIPLMISGVFYPIGR